MSKQKHTSNRPPRDSIAYLIGPMLYQHGFIPVIQDKDGMILHRPIDLIGPCFEFPSIPMDCRTLDIDYDPFDMSVLDLPPDELEDFDARWCFANEAIARRLGIIP